MEKEYLKDPENQNNGLMTHKVTAADFMTFARIALSVALACLEPLTMQFFAVYLLCGATDMLDGFIARKTHTETDFGARLDSIADLIFCGVCVIKIFPGLELEKATWYWICGIALIRVVNLIIGFRAFGRLTALHTPANRFTGLMLFAFPLFMLSENYRLIAAIICIVASFSALQELYLLVSGNREQI